MESPSYLKQCKRRRLSSNIEGRVLRGTWHSLAPRELKRSGAFSGWERLRLVLHFSEGRVLRQWHALQAPREAGKIRGLLGAQDWERLRLVRRFLALAGSPAGFSSALPGPGGPVAGLGLGSSSAGREGAFCLRAFPEPALNCDWDALNRRTTAQQIIELELQTPILQVYAQLCDDSCWASRSDDQQGGT